VDYGRVNEIIAENAELILDKLEIDHKVYKDRISMRCPIHDSSKDESLSLFTDGEKYSGNYVCWTNHCEKDNGNGALNLIKVILEEKQKKKIRLKDVVDWVLETTKSLLPESSINAKEKKSFVKYVDSLNKSKPSIQAKITREYVRSTLIIPCEYYIKRGYSPETLDNFDVGLCVKPKTQMFMRAVVPVYHDNYMVGCVGRSLNDKCPICGKYHHKNKMCPTNKIEERWAEKWVNSESFTCSKYFYTGAKTLQAVKDSKSVILVEGQGDVWRLSEAGFDNVFGLFGCSLSEDQKLILEQMGIYNIYLALDSDEAGISGRNKINSALKRYYNIQNIELPNKDFGDMTIEEVKTTLKGIV
jgi:5S rRNA maturation endonuclease (ribonuclease M5)